MTVRLLGRVLQSAAMQSAVMARLPSLGERIGRNGMLLHRPLYALSESPVGGRMTYVARTFPFVNRRGGQIQCAAYFQQAVNRWTPSTPSDCCSKAMVVAATATGDGRIEDVVVRKFATLQSINLVDSSSAVNHGWQHVQQRFRSHVNSETTLQQHYNRLPIRKKFLRAVKRGTLVWDKGQVKLPPIAIEGYDPPRRTLTSFQKHMRNQFKGKLHTLRARRLWFHD